MPASYTPGSFTKNFSWDHSYERLFLSIRSGFENSLFPVSRDSWRTRSGIPDKDRQLVPLNFFLYSFHGANGDYVLVDRLVEFAIERKYSNEFAQLSLFAFHLAMSGQWKRSKWPDGKVAGWANELVCNSVRSSGEWDATAFREENIEQFLQDKLRAQPETKRKVLTNYLFMLESAGVLNDGLLQRPNLAQRWYVDAVQLFWDRHLFNGQLPPGGGQSKMESAFFENEVHKLLNCSEVQAQAFVRTAAREYSALRASREAQLENLLQQSGKTPILTQAAS